MRIGGVHRLATAGHDPSQEHSLSIGYDSTEDQDNIFYNWDKYGANDLELIRKLYAEAIEQILERLGGFPDISLANLPTYRTSKQAILRKIPKTHELQMLPKLPAYMQTEQDGADFDKTKVSAKYLDSKKQRKIYEMINQTLNGLCDDDHQKKYYNYLMSNGIKIVSDIFERMDNDRKIGESLRRLQAMDGLSEQEFYNKKQMLMRKMTAKATAFLYEK